MFCYCELVTSVVYDDILVPVQCSREYNKNSNHLHTFQLFIHANKTTNIWSQQHSFSWSVWTTIFRTHTAIECLSSTCPLETLSCHPCSELHSLNSSSTVVLCNKHDIAACSGSPHNTCILLVTRKRLLSTIHFPLTCRHQNGLSSFSKLLFDW